ncbi:TLDc domain-containing protein [Entamoeba marina]
MSTQLSFQSKLIQELLNWSTSKNYTILFDSDLHGNGLNTLEYSVLNKKRIYLITIDNNTNVFGGYISEKIDRINYDIVDKNSFVFSLIRNGVMKNKKYNIKRNISDAIYFVHNTDYGFLYEFGDKDITIYNVGNSYCNCNQHWFEYKEEKQALTNVDQDFTAQRLIVLEMN